MNQSTQILTSKLPTFWLHLFLGFSSFFVYPLITLSIVASAGTPITVDPYNDSSFEPLSIETSPIKTNSSSNNNKALPTDNQNSTMGEILINGNPTPPPPNLVSGNLIKSNETLPQIPALSEPYRNPNVNNDINQNSPDSEEITGKTTTLSVSVSPFDQTPDENQPNLTSKKTVDRSDNLNNTPRSINLSPNASATVNKTSTNAENINATSPQPVNSTNLGRRRSLNDILVFSAPSENKSNSSTVAPTTSVNQAMTLTTKTNNIYKVLVKVNNSAQESQVKSLYPEAFQTNLKGEEMLQVGVFSNPETAQKVSNSLKNMGFKAVLSN
jgi:hypothetical protein